MRFFKSFILFFVPCIGGMSIASVPVAHARTIHATACQIDPSTTPVSTGEPAYNGVVSWGVMENVYNQYVAFCCPVSSDSSVAMGSISSIHASVKIPGGSTMSVGACTTNYDATGGHCGTYAATSSGAGYYGLYPAVSAWNTYTYDYAFLSVSSPPGGKIMGFTYSQ